MSADKEQFPIATWLYIVISFIGLGHHCRKVVITLVFNATWRQSQLKAHRSASMILSELCHQIQLCYAYQAPVLVTGQIELDPFIHEE